MQGTNRTTNEGLGVERRRCQIGYGGDISLSTLDTTYPTKNESKGLVHIILQTMEFA